MDANKPMFVVGIVLILASAAMFIFLEQNLTTPIILLIIGIVMMGASKYRLLKQSS